MINREPLANLDISEIPPERIILLKGTIDWPRVDAIVEKLHELSAKPTPVLIEFNSRGGEFWDGLHLYDRFRLSAVPVVGRVMGVAHSAALTALQGCHLRIASANARFVLHEPYMELRTRLKRRTGTSVLEFVATQIDAVSENSLRVLNILLERVGATADEVMRRKVENLFFGEERILTPEEILEFRFLDRIV